MIFLNQIGKKMLPWNKIQVIGFWMFFILIAFLSFYHIPEHAMFPCNCEYQAYIAHVEKNEIYQSIDFTVVKGNEVFLPHYTLVWKNDENLEAILEAFKRKEKIMLYETCNLFNQCHASGKLQVEKTYGVNFFYYIYYFCLVMLYFCMFFISIDYTVYMWKMMK